MGDNKKKSVNMTALIGAAFLMATSAIGPGFLTQTATFTGTYGATFALAIICTILLDVTTQFNIWSIIGVSGLRGQDIANKVLPGLGYFIAFLVSVGGLVFNIGNVGGAATGFNILFGLPLTAGTVIAGAIGILIFLSKDAKAGMDKLTKYLGSIMIITVLYVAFKCKPPVGEAVASVANVGEFPNLVFPIITLLGGRVAEQLVLDDISTGASNDLERATSTARSMVTRYGFSEKLGPIVYGNDQNEVFLGRDLGSSRDYSDRVAGEIDDEVRNIVEKAYDKATAILQMHMDQLELLAKYLMIHEKIEKDDFETLMQGKMDPSQFEETPAEPETSATEAEPTEEKPTENGDSSAPTEA